MGSWNKWRGPIPWEDAVYAAKARRRLLDGEHGVLGFSANGNHVFGLSGRPRDRSAGAPTDPDVQDSRIRLFESSSR